MDGRIHLIITVFWKTAGYGVSFPCRALRMFDDERVSVLYMVNIWQGERGVALQEKGRRCPEPLRRPAGARIAGMSVHDISLYLVMPW